ncbi:MAG TPA: endolytic transglycosylase MltG, partial [bacterium]|nr:endolytic transglycosylase MltG [bacterium]
HGADRSIRPGTYLFYPGRSPLDLLDDLVQGRLLMHRLTVPEGWRLEQIAKETERVLGIAATDFLTHAASPNRVLSAGSRAATVEGYLFPETYFFEDGVGSDTVLDEMMARFETNWAKLTAGVDSLPLGLDRHAIVTLASIVEAETGVPEERPRIAAVYFNRLAEGWKLQADPTVRYALGKYEQNVLYKDLAAELPYNTYWATGLPPGPIGSPGAAALEATIHPLYPCEDFFFVASGNGGHVFSKTMRDHNLAKGAFKKVRAQTQRAGEAPPGGPRRSG